MTEQDRGDDPLIRALTAYLPPLIAALDALGYVARKLHPPNLEALLAEVAGVEAGVRDGRAAFAEAPWPDRLHPVRDRILKAGDHVVAAYGELAAARDQANPVMGAYRALRHSSRASEALYPVAAVLPPVSRFFLEPDQRDDPARIQALAAGAARTDTGLIEADNAKNQRGGFSLYVPEDYDETAPTPLIMALHGGSGHGRDFLWLWLREARSRGALLIAPTSRGDTWALMGDDPDTANIEAMLAYVRGRWNVDPAHLLLTGMSDGGTFTYVTGLRADSPFTHLAPVSAAFHPMLSELADPARTAGLPVYVAHGALDWMFPYKFAQTAAETLRARGAETVLDVIPDLSHTYPREVNGRILDWFLPARGAQ